MNYYITDNEGSLIEVTDLKEALFQVAAYLRYEPSGLTVEQLDFFRKRLKYWKNIYDQLVRIKYEAEKNGEYPSI